MAASRTPLIALLTDFGTADWYAACMKGVILRTRPQTHLVDITHEIPPQDVAAGAFTLAAAAPWFPAQTVFACVVDPGVGTERPLLAAEADGQRFVAPDNGLLSLVLERAKRRALVKLTNPRCWLPAVSHTFHGRDIIAPVAAELAQGRPLRQFGIPVRRYRTLAIPPLKRLGRTLTGCVLHLDAFGNLITNLPAGLLALPSRWEVRYQQRRVRVVSSYEEGRPNELLAIAGSLGYVELAVRNGSAAARCRAKRYDPVRLCDTSRPATAGSS
ncbi:MAG: SAM-dependent chlorinase/fluorinase [Candidatus Omnitrophica bacterium]|nr:SAM-dependent chlorinase/fluorinase [Candidatus Omnitrophota bacterium]